MPRALGNRTARDLGPHGVTVAIGDAWLTPHPPGSQYPAEENDCWSFLVAQPSNVPGDQTSRPNVFMGQIHFVLMLIDPAPTVPCVAEAVTRPREGKAFQEPRKQALWARSLSSNYPLPGMLPASPTNHNFGRNTGPKPVRGRSQVPPLSE